jgi:hypothetical protein
MGTSHHADGNPSFLERHYPRALIKDALKDSECRDVDTSFIRDVLWIVWTPNIRVRE